MRTAKGVHPSPLLKWTQSSRIRPAQPDPTPFPPHFVDSNLDPENALSHAGAELPDATWKVSHDMS